MNGSIRDFFAKCRELLVRAFRKKTPISVRRFGEGGAKGGTEKVRSFVTFFTDGLPKGVCKLYILFSDVKGKLVFGKVNEYLEKKTKGLFLV